MREKITYLHIINQETIKKIRISIPEIRQIHVLVDVSSLCIDLLQTWVVFKLLAKDKDDSRKESQSVTYNVSSEAQRSQQQEESTL